MIEITLSMPEWMMIALQIMILIWLVLKAYEVYLKHKQYMLTRKIRNEWSVTSRPS